MSAERYARMTRLFLEACSLESEQRGVFLARACADDPALRHEIEALMDCDARPAAVDRPMIDTLAREELAAGPPTPWVPERIGQYEVVDRLGAGGMGVVYKARQLHSARQLVFRRTGD
jgi:serine/threonine-protein kinase